MSDTTVRIQVRADKALKDRATAVFRGMGLDLGSAINMFLAQSVNDGALPFQPSLSPFDREMMEAEASPTLHAGSAQAMKDIIDAV